MPEIPDPPPSQPALPSAEAPSPEQSGPDGADGASLRLLLDALVRRLRRQPLVLAERALGQEGDRTHPKA